MAINKKLIHFKSKENFDNEVANGNILDTSICFILDSKEISTHGTVYKTVNWSVLGVAIITFTIDGVEYLAEEGMNFMLWCDSKYNTTDASKRLIYNNTSLDLFYKLESGMYLITLIEKTLIIELGKTYSTVVN